MKLGYKAVTVLVDGEGKEFFTGTIVKNTKYDNYEGVTYEIGKGVRPKAGCGPLMVCKKLEGLKYLGGDKVFLVAYKPSKQIRLFTLSRGFRVCSNHRNKTYDTASEVMLIQEVPCLSAL